MRRHASLRRVRRLGSTVSLIDAAGNETSSYHFGQRYPVIGRFTQQDPLDQVADLRQGNPYVYAGDDPVNLLDPSGSASCSTFGLGGLQEGKAGPKAIGKAKDYVDTATGKGAEEAWDRVVSLTNCYHAFQDGRLSNREAYYCAPTDLITGIPEDAH